MAHARCNSEKHSARGLRRRQNVAMKSLVAVFALAILAAVAGWYGYRSISERRAEESIERFLARHWADPIAPQGDPPATHAPAEAALAPEGCGACHAVQYTDWKGSLHARAMGPGILWQLRALGQGEANGCLRCHAPLAEQKALLAIERGWTNRPSAPPPDWVAGDLHRQGLVCAACHVRRHARYGPMPRTNAAKVSDGQRQPHGGYSAQAAFSDSRFCSPCHQFPPEGRSVNGKLLENTYGEWRESRHAREGRSCQSCHMPDRRHLWRGIHDPEMVRRALGREMQVTRLDDTRARVTVTLANREAGHYLPTYVVPRIVVEIRLRGGGGQRSMHRHVIGRELDLALEREIRDTRLPPDGQHTYSIDVALGPGEWRIALGTEVAPAEHYVRTFTDLRDRLSGLDAQTRRLLDEAIRQAADASYAIEELEVAVPRKSGEDARVAAR